MNIEDKISYFLNEADKGEDDGGDKWSGDVKTKWHPKEGIFTKGATEIARYLAKNSSSLKKAMARLNFYINRAGSNLPADRRKTLKQAKEKLRKEMGEE